MYTDEDNYRMSHLSDNLKNMRQEMGYWKNPEVMEAEENLEHLIDEAPLGG